MKKIAIIAAIILTTAVTAFALTRKENTAEVAKMKIENSNNTTTVNRATASLATAD